MIHIIQLKRYLYFQHLKRNSLYKLLYSILYKNNYTPKISDPLILYDFLLFWHFSLPAQKYIIYLFLKLKYNRNLQKFTIDRYNILWHLRRNFFLINIHSLFFNPYITTIKQYVILRQLLDDKQDKHIDKNQISTIYTFKKYKFPNKLYTKHLESNIKTYFTSLKPNSIPNFILQFYLEFL